MSEYETSFTSDDVDTALSVLDNSLTRQLETWLQVCAHCGLCIDSCHYWQALHEPTVVPPYKADRLRRVWKRHYDWLGRAVPFWVGASELDEEGLEEMALTAFRDCTMCSRCVLDCPFGVDMRMIVGTMRSMVSATGKGPEILSQLADVAIAREENLDLFEELLVGQLGMLEEELKATTGDPAARIPLNEPARVLYVPLSGAHTIVPAATIFHRAGESWTLSMFEASNYAVFLGDTARAKRIADRIVNEAIRLGVEEVVITECGHAFSTMRWTAPNWYDEPLPFDVRSIVEIIHDYVQEGRVVLQKTDHMGPVTLHDPCNVGRNGGVLDEPRAVINAAVTDFREMTPNREHSYCCGGGSGLVANPDFEERRLAAGQPKAESIRRSGAKVVVASCDNCRHQIKDLNDHYGLDVEVIGLAELTVEAMVPA